MSGRPGKGTSAKHSERKQLWPPLPRQRVRRKDLCVQGGTRGGTLRKSECAHSGNRSPPTPEIGVRPLRESESTIWCGINGGKNTMVRTSGVCTQTHRKNSPLANIEKSDLTDTGRLLALFAAAVESKIVDGTDARQLDWVGMAERALRVARKPVSMFVSNVLAGDRWHFVSSRDEQAAQERIKHHRYGDTEVDDAAGSDVRRRLISELESERRQ